MKTKNKSINKKSKTKKNEKVFLFEYKYFAETYRGEY